MSEKVRRLEELSLNAWPAIQTVLDDGWVIRLAKGYTKRANSVNPLYPSLEDTNQKIDKYEEFFQDRCLPPVYKVTPAICPEDLDRVLENRGYHRIDETSVQILSLETLPEPRSTEVVIYQTFTLEWLENYGRLSALPERHFTTARQMLAVIVPPVFFAALPVDGKIIACGMGVVDKGYLGIFDIVVDPHHRQKGYGKDLVTHLLHEGKNRGAKESYLQVMVNNLPAWSLYARLGYREEYRYWYRVKETVSG